MNEGNNSGRGIGCVQLGWRGVCGSILAASQFWEMCLQRPRFQKSGVTKPIRFWEKLKDKKKYVQGPVCILPVAGYLRRKFFGFVPKPLTGDVWAPDPACYLSDEEISEAV